MKVLLCVVITDTSASCSVSGWSAGGASGSSAEDAGSVPVEPVTASQASTAACQLGFACGTDMSFSQCCTGCTTVAYTVLDTGGGSSCGSIGSDSSGTSLGPAPTEPVKCSNHSTFVRVVCRLGRNPFFG